MARKIYITIESDGLINALSLSKTPNPDEIECEVEDDHEVIQYRLVVRSKDGKIIKDHEYQKKEMERREFWENRPSVDSQISDLGFQLMSLDSEVMETQETVAASMFELMEIDSEVKATQTSNAELLFQLMMKGVL